MYKGIPPPELSKEKRYFQYRKELLVWKEIAEGKNFGITVALSLPEHGERDDIRKYVLDALPNDQVKAKDCFYMVLSVLDRHLGMLEILDLFEKLHYFKGCHQQSVDQYIAEFEALNSSISEIMKPEDNHVYNFLIGANLSKEDRKAVINGMNSDYENTGNLYELAKNSLKRFASKAVNIPVARTVPQTPCGLLQQEPGMMPCFGNNQHTQLIDQTQHVQPKQEPGMMPCFGNNQHTQLIDLTQHVQPNPGPGMMPCFGDNQHTKLIDQTQHVQPYPGPGMMPYFKDNGFPQNNTMIYPQQQMQHGQPYIPMCGYGYGLPMNRFFF